ncbi:hypothetical protein [Pandoraea communis]|uniref:hypothetical protein n=1 Tax=Pandoraea communis TaxID=2508297 RepID=UPI0025A64B2B|nr:hypothetical protein [Pandoraea communis]MDM8356596.1 hypothetical protein [Pandoraea communis]
MPQLHDDASSKEAATAQSLARTLALLNSAFPVSEVRRSTQPVTEQPDASPVEVTGADHKRYGSIYVAQTEADFLRSIGITVGAYDHDAGRFPAMVSAHRAADAMEYLAQFQYQFDLVPFDERLVGQPPDTLAANDRRAMGAYLDFQLAGTPSDLDRQDLEDLRDKLAAFSTGTAAPVQESSNQAQVDFELS